MYEIFKKQQQIVRLQNEIIEALATEVQHLDDPDRDFAEAYERILRDGPTSPRGEVLPPPPSPALDVIERDIRAMDRRRK